MKAICDAGNVGANLISDSVSKKFTLPPLPMSFEGTFDLIPFILYDCLIMDENSVEYLFQEKLLSDKAKTLLRDLITEGIVELHDYSKTLRPKKDEVIEQAEKDYKFLKNEAQEKGSHSHYFTSKNEWLKFAQNIEKSENKSIAFPDTEKSVRDNLSRILHNKLIPRDYKFLKSNILDVNCVYHLANEFNAPILCWSDWSIYYSYKNKQHVHEYNMKEVKKQIVTNLWNLHFPKLSLHKISPDAFYKLITSGYIKEIRSFVERTKMKPEGISPEWYKHIKKVAARDEFGINIFKKVAIAGSIITGFVTQDPYTGAGLSVASAGAEKVLEKAVQHKNRIHYTFQKCKEVIGEFAE